MADLVHTELNRLRRRVAAALFVEGTVFAACAIASVGLTTLLAVRLLGVWWEPRWTWLAVGGGAALAWGLVAAWRGAWSRAALAAHVDRRHALRGLLVSGLERDASAWEPMLVRALRGSTARLPSWAPRRWLVRIGAVAASATVVAILPPPEPGPVERPLLTAELERIADDVELALEAGSLDESEAEELRERVGELERVIGKGEDVDWSDADGLAERLAHEESVRIDRLKAMRAQLSAYSAAEDAGSAAAQRDLAAALEHAAALGLAEELPEEVRELLEELREAAQADGAALAEGAVDLSALDMNAGELQQLAGGLERAVDGQLAQLGEVGKLGREDLEDLEKLLAEARGGQAFGPNPAKTRMPGDGGVDRGRGDALLLYENDSDTDTSKLGVERLPPGVAAPREWSVVGLRRTSPELSPTPDVGAGGESVEGGGRVTWRRRLAPRHRDAVRRFFSSRGQEAPR